MKLICYIVAKTLLHVTSLKRFSFKILLIKKHEFCYDFSNKITWKEKNVQPRHQKSNGLSLKRKKITTQKIFFGTISNIDNERSLDIGYKIINC